VIPSANQRGARIERSEPHLEGLPRAGLGEIGLGQQKAVGDRRLLRRNPRATLRSAVLPE
jgi:hypothetical protein